MSGGMQLPEGGRPGRHLAGMLVFQQVERQEVGRQGRRKRVLTQGQGHRKRMLLPHRSGHLQHPAPPKREGEEGPGFHSALQHARGVPDGGDEHQVPLSVFRGGGTAWVELLGWAEGSRPSPWTSACPEGWPCESHGCRPVIQPLAIRRWRDPDNPQVPREVVLSRGGQTHFSHSVKPFRSNAVMGREGGGTFTNEYHP